MSWLRAIPFLFTLLAFVLQPASASALGNAHPEARVSAFELVAMAGVGASAETSPGLHEGIAEAYDETASGYRFASRGGGNTVYRALTAADAEAIAAGRGLAAKAPNGTWTAAEHVANSGPGVGGAAVNSPWISTSRSLDVARAYDSGHGVVAIDVSRVPSFMTEVWQHAPRVNGVAGLPYHRSIWAQEVTVFQSVPAGAIKGLVP